jgi:uncharacterized repeat protein (TIGR03803 family)
MRWRRLWVRCSFIGLSSLLSATPAPAQVVNMLHSFAGGPNDGKNPFGSLLQSGSNFYGMTSSGGSAGPGTVFQMGMDGTGFGVIHSFAGGANDGRNPTGSLIQSGSNLYGMTQFGGVGGNGVILQIGANGSNFAVNHLFGGPPSDGSTPLGSLVQSGTTVFGLTPQGGNANLGTIFRAGIDGTGYNVLHSFMGGPMDGSSPLYASLVQSGANLYGMTSGGGVSGLGTIFRIGLDGSGLTVIHSFAGGAADGQDPLGSLTVSGSTLFGMTNNGGSTNNGTIFKIGIDGSGLNVLHSFMGGPSDGANPSGDLLLDGSELYGMTGLGGSANLGTILGIGTDGTGYNVIHSFLGGANDGANPQADLTLVGANLYGTTSTGGAANFGTVFSVTPIPEPSSFLLAGLGGCLGMFARWKRSRRGVH